MCPEQLVPGRQTFQGFVQALWSVVGVCRGRRNVWSVGFRVAVPLGVALQAHPVVAVRLLPQSKDTGRY